MVKRSRSKCDLEVYMMIPEYGQAKSNQENQQTYLLWGRGSFHGMHTRYQFTQYSPLSMKKVMQKIQSCQSDIFLSIDKANRGTKRIQGPKNPYCIVQKGNNFLFLVRLDFIFLWI